MARRATKVTKTPGYLPEPRLSRSRRFYRRPQRSRCTRVRGLSEKTRLLTQGGSVSKMQELPAFAEWLKAMVADASGSVSRFCCVEYAIRLSEGFGLHGSVCELSVLRPKERRSRRTAGVLAAMWRVVIFWRI
jgi:hypothetical protein